MIFNISDAKHWLNTGKLPTAHAPHHDCMVANFPHQKKATYQLKTRNPKFGFMQISTVGTFTRPLTPRDGVNATCWMFF